MLSESLMEASETDCADSFPVKSLHNIKKLKLLTLCISSDYGGEDLGLKAGSNLALLTILKHIGSGNLVMGRVLEGHMNAQILIAQYGTEDQKKKFAAEAFAGHLFGVWNTQAEVGTTLNLNSISNYYLNGAKTFATGIDYVTRPIVTAALDDSWQMCIVPLDEIKAKVDPSWWNPMGMKASRSYKITFEDIEIPKDHLLGKEGSYYEQPYFSGGSVRFSAVQLGAAEMLLEETIAYLKTLKRTEDHFQKMRIGEMSILIESGNQWLKSAAEYLDQFMNDGSDENAKLFLNQANMVRTAIDEICIKTMSLCQKCIGARGLNKPYHFERIIRDLNTYLRQPAPDHSIMEVGRFALENKVL